MPNKNAPIELGRQICFAGLMPELSNRFKQQLEAIVNITEELSLFGNYKFGLPVIDFTSQLKSFADKKDYPGIK